jgi:hypothetical protein
MVLRFFILSAIAFVGLSLLSSPAIPEAPATESSKAAIEQDQQTVVALPTTSHRARLSTRDRWRGTPYLRSNRDETLRNHVLDKALFPANPAFQGAVTFRVPR